MNWSRALQHLQLSAPLPEAAERGECALRAVRAGSICVASGKGGTGKSVVSSALSALCARRGRALLFDADFGVGNAHILQDVHPQRTLFDVVQGEASVLDIVTPCGDGLDLVGAGSGFSSLAALSNEQQERIAAGLSQIETGYDFVVVDSAAGISPQTVSYAAACDIVLLVTTPDVTAMTDAYALLKVLSQSRTTAQPLLVVNRAVEPEDGARTATRIAEVAAKFLGRDLRWIATLPEDRAVSRSIAARRVVVESEPQAPISLALRELAEHLVDELAQSPRRGVGHTLADRLAALG